VQLDSGSYQTATPKSTGDWSTWSTKLSITTTGTHKIQARATDNAGNQNWYSVTISVTGTVTADTTAPAIKITSPAANQKLAKGTITITGTASDTGSGVKTVQVHVDSGSYVTATPKSTGDWSTWSAQLKITSGGTHKIQARATDNAGNQNWYSVSISVR